MTIAPSVDVIPGSQRVMVSQGNKSALVLAAKRTRVRAHEASASSGRFTSRDAKWRIDFDSLQAFVPKPGAIVTPHDEEDVWVAIQVDKSVVNSRWVLWCVNATLEGETEKVTLERRQATLDAERAPDDSWEVVGGAVEAVVVETASVLRQGNDRREVASGFMVFIKLKDAPLDVQADDRLTRPSGERLYIREVKGKANLNGVVEMKAEEANNDD